MERASETRDWTFVTVEDMALGPDMGPDIAFAAERRAVRKFWAMDLMTMIFSVDIQIWPC